MDLGLAVAKASARTDRGEGRAAEQAPPAADPQQDAAREAARRAGAIPDPRLVLREDPRRLGLWRSVRYIFAIPSNVLMIVGSSLGYFYFAGLQTFALLFVKGHYAADQATAELALALLVVGAVIGTLLGGRVTDAMLRRGNLAARVWFPGACYLGAALLLIPGFVGVAMLSYAMFLAAPVE